jgi:peroxiredoxin
MKRLFILLLGVFVTISVYSQDDIVLKGQMAPDFTLKTDKGNLKLSDLKGKVVLVNFFATWCGPCRQELPEVQTKIWDKYKNNPSFSLLIIARQQTRQEVNDFKIQSKFTMPFYVDTDRSIYSLYAKQYIPRNYLIDKNGKVIYLSQGYSVEEFANLLKTIETELGETP